MIRLDVLEEYKGIDAVMDYIKGTCIYSTIWTLGLTAAAIAANSCKRKIAPILMVASTIIAASALSDEYFDRSCKYLYNKIAEKKMKRKADKLKGTL